MIGVVADDLTGAAELAGLGWRRGLKAEILGPAPPSPDAGLVCIDTHSRSLPSEEAARAATLAVRRLRQLGARWIYKKVDSVLRGHVMAEVSAILEEVGCQTALIVPANPGRARVIRNGEYFIRDVPIHRTHFSRDPEYPRWTSNVTELLGGSWAGRVRICPAETPRLPEGVLVGEAASNADLERWARRLSPGVLPAGAAEFFEVLLTAEACPRAERQGCCAPGLLAEPQLFVCGSQSEAALRFVEEARRHGVPVLHPPEPPASDRAGGPGPDDAFVCQATESLRRHPCVVLAASSIEIADPAAAQEAFQRFTRLAFEILRDGSVSHVCVEGGATAAGLLAHLAWERLCVTRELTPGVVTLKAHGRRPLDLSLKPGSYEWPEAIRSRVQSGPSKT